MPRSPLAGVHDMAFYKLGFVQELERHHWTREEIIEAIREHSALKGVPFPDGTVYEQ